MYMYARMLCCAHASYVHTQRYSRSDSPFDMTTIYHNRLSLSFRDPVAGSRVAVSSLTYKTTRLYKVHDASVSIWQRAEQEAARWGSVCAVLSSSPPPRSLAPDLDWLLIPGGKDILDFEKAGIALDVA